LGVRTKTGGRGVLGQRAIVYSFWGQNLDKVANSSYT
jgi:hypothetical protein